ncbi:hypothetical protein MIND_01160000 [Mycena indigotica]|uniref:Uncharacterized protein n=1 Tax=Mycena indigotica TaxID=2126181 RepID=A0A8H6VUP0_9AGAR|nr:uncharacterized protein MIND_01160000 [Mycena indigotica]KAF7292621.1 hypothetical protein MIND_01160000 [Mycena indigotica]
MESPRDGENDHQPNKTPDGAQVPASRAMVEEGVVEEGWSAVLRAKPQALSQYHILCVGRAHSRTKLFKMFAAYADSARSSESTTPTSAVSSDGTAIRASPIVLTKDNIMISMHDPVPLTKTSGVDTEEIKHFIQVRSKAFALSEKLHAIWICIATEMYQPPSYNEVLFLNRKIATSVPTFLVVTRFDELVTQAFMQLKPLVGIVEARVKRFDLGREILQNTIIEPLWRTPLPPHGFLILTDENSTFIENLLLQTMKMLTPSTINDMKHSILQNYVDFNTENAIKKSGSCLTIGFPFFIP